jgi:hypothetical protein
MIPLSPVATTLVCFLFRARGCGCGEHPVFPAPSDDGERMCCNTRARTRGGKVDAHQNDNDEVTILSLSSSLKGVATLIAYHHRFIKRAPHGESVSLDVLRQWTKSGSIEAALAAMAKKIDLPHWGSKGAINRAGEALRNKALGQAQAEVLESWRMAHRDVINTFQAILRTRARNLDIQVAQRLKRRSTIIDKLSRHAGMQLLAWTM